MMDRKSLGVEDKAMARPGVDDDTKEWPRWRCTNLACKSDYPPGRNPGPRCPLCGAATEAVPTKGE